jgi:hypothetical protein
MRRERPELLTDERTEETVKCRVCGRVVPFEKSRLFWGPGGGTVRTCAKGIAPHRPPAR